jgi:N-acetylmuramoyl-L-alanine amidase
MTRAGWSSLPLVVLILSAEVAQAASVKSVRLYRAEDHTRVVLDMDAPAQYTAVLAENPERVILTVPDSSLKGSLKSLSLAKTPIEIVRDSIVNKNDLRLVFDLRQPVRLKSFFLKKRDGNNDRLVLDFYDAPELAQAKAEAANRPASKPAAKPVVVEAKPSVTDKSPELVSETIKSEPRKTPVVSEAANIEAMAGDAPGEQPVSKPVATSGKPILIAVDAGHGGEDTGALGPSGMREKDVTLAIAKELARVINAQPGYKANLTRYNDTFVVLQKRRDLARDMKADLFISIHADSFTDSSAYGASVFALSRKGATSEMARFLAQRENESDLVGRVGGVSLEDKDAVLAGVLVDLSMTATVNSSLQLGSKVLNAISGIAPLHAKHVEQAGFVVLKSPDVPSILVETGFISNPGESKKLASTTYREQMARAIFKGVQQYFGQYPAADKTLAENDEPRAAEKPAAPAKAVVTKAKPKKKTKS